jgi:DNA polymerase-4
MKANGRAVIALSNGKRMAQSHRAIIHVDMDAFYASVEQLDHPAWRGLPVVVGGLGRRGVVSTASYEARRYGVRSAQPTATARRLCPQATFVAPRMARYAEVSSQVFEILHRLTPEVESLSLDEAFLDVSASRSLFGSLHDMGRRVKAEVRSTTGLNCSVGLSHNKFLAKLATELGKPDGLYAIAPETMDAVLSDLPVGRLWTVGKVTEAHLQGAGVRTVADLRALDMTALSRLVGTAHAELLHDLARGIDARPVVPDRDEQSLGAETTFDLDLSSLSQAQTWLMRLTERVAARARRLDRLGRTVTVKLRVPPFETMTRQCSLAAPSHATAEIYAAAETLLRTWWRERRRPQLRLLGVSVSGFDAPAGQSDLFAQPRAGRADAVTDAINAKFGAHVIGRARGR